jgi:hypothetical protein
MEDSGSPIVPVDYRREDDRFLVAGNRVTLSNPDFLSSNKTAVNLGTRI